ncbi:MAG: Lipoprotein LpqB beta-propeller protein [Pseudonocardiales bacterium]|nr:Lipoprotein LpqB beta-propeller protein [Pseudonocardiales bacterium]
MTRRLLTLLTVAVLLAGCTGVPSSSSPQVVNPVGVATPTGAPQITPAPGADPRTIVTAFLAASATDDLRYTAAHGFLTSEAKQRWSYNTLTIVDSVQVSNFVDGAVTVTGRKIGSVSSVGVYTPVLQGNGSGGVPVPFSFGMKRNAGQWRIDTLQNGVVLTADEFQRFYRQRSLYFFDLAEKRLVPDPRYSPLSDPKLLATWLISQLAAGPRVELQSAVSIELPAQTDPSGVSITLGSPIRVTLPGAGQLDPQTRNRLAAQVALTLQQATASVEITIIDGGRAVSIPQVGGDVFNAAEFAAMSSPANPAPALYYLRNQGVVDETGKPLPGDLGNGHYQLDSVALASIGQPDLWVAGITGTGTGARLLVGSRNTGLRATPVLGRLSRPSWAPGLDEVWVGDGPLVYRVQLNGRRSVVPVTGTSGAVSGRVTALRFSPEGTRVAVVLTATDGTAQVWVGSVVRTRAQGGQVRVDSLEPVTPQGVAVTDVAWNDQLKLFAIGRDLTTGDPSVYEVQVDGSLWTPRGISNLPVPDSITVAQNEVAWVSAGGTVWAQQASAWTSRGTEGAFCTNPIYLE